VTFFSVIILVPDDNYINCVPDDCVGINYNYCVFQKQVTVTDWCAKSASEHV